MKFRTRPVVIDAIQWTGENAADVLVFCEFNCSCGLLDDKRVVTLATREGPMVAQVGDWIVRGVEGELYPCAPDTFKATHEAVAE